MNKCYEADRTCDEKNAVMSTEREQKLFMAQALDQTNRRRDMVDLMREVITLNPVLSAEERSLLSVAYKELIAVHRNGLRVLAEMSVDEKAPQRLSMLADVRSRITKDLESTCNELITLINDTLIPAAQDAQARLFYEKMKGDYYRYLCEACGNPADTVEQAKKSYESAVAIAKAELSPARPLYLGLMLNYTVFMYEMLDQRAEAIRIANATYEEATQQLNSNSEGSYADATEILQLLKGNVALWDSKQ